MELFKLLLLIACSAILLLVILPAIIVFFIFRAREPQKFAQRAKAGVIVGIVLAVLLLGVIVWDAVDLFLPDDPLPPSPEQTAETTEAQEETTAAPTVEETVEETEAVPLATVSGEDLQGVWVACAEPVISEDTNYTRVTKAGYYEFDGTHFTFTQIQLAEQGIWTHKEDQDIVYRGTYELHGDILTLHYTEEAGQAVDYTEKVSMIVDRSCADMCVRTPDHPKLGTLMFFRKARQGDPVNAITVLLTGGL